METGIKDHLLEEEGSVEPSI